MDVSEFGVSSVEKLMVKWEDESLLLQSSQVANPPKLVIQEDKDGNSVIEKLTEGREAARVGQCTRLTSDFFPFYY